MPSSSTKRRHSSQVRVNRPHISSALQVTFAEGLGHILQAHRGWASIGCLQPIFEIANPNPMFDRGLPDLHRDISSTMPNLANPFIGAKHPEALRHRFVEAVRGDFDRVLRSI
jgi:hypothetical protein